jgi:hypothetical protein
VSATEAPIRTAAALSVGALLLAPLGTELVPRMVRAGEKERVRTGIRELVTAVLTARVDPSHDAGGHPG